MQCRRTRVRALGAIASLAILTAPAAVAQGATSATSDLVGLSIDGDEGWLESVAPTRSDVAAAAAARAAAAHDTAFRLVISLADRRLWALDGDDTLLVATAGVGMDKRLRYEGRSWTFRTPRGVRTVLSKTMRSAWIPPDWHYAEVARKYGFRLAHLPADSSVMLSNGTVLEVRFGEAGLARPDGRFTPLPVDEEIVFDSTVFVPPADSRNRRIEGELGRYQLDLGDDYLVHGTPRKASIGTATTHGCVRVGDKAARWLYYNVPVGTSVYIY